MELYLGIDTSCYITSLAVVDGEGNLFSEARKILTVPSGGRGLAQSKAVFQHLTNLPELCSKVAPAEGLTALQGIAASTRPRPVEGSYMPVFKVAESYGRSAAGLLGIPFVKTTHQEGHLAAGIWSANGPRESEFLAVHLSGGTTELLHVESGSFKISLLGGGTDLHAGQFIDRVGVSMGLPFPAGPHLEQLAQKSQANLSIPSSVKGYEISFSGPEAAALRMIKRNMGAGDVARAVEKCIANSLEKVLKKAIADTGLRSILIVGGVAANKYIRDRLTARLQHQAIKAVLYFASPGLSSDNAVGVALIGRSNLKKPC